MDQSIPQTDDLWIVLDSSSRPGLDLLDPAQGLADDLQVALGRLPDTPVSKEGLERDAGGYPH